MSKVATKEKFTQKAGKVFGKVEKVGNMGRRRFPEVLNNFNNS